MPRLFHQTCDVLNVRHISICEVSCGRTFPPRSPSAPYSVDVADQASGEIKIYDTVDSLEVNPSGHKVSANKYPDITSSELFNDLISVSLLLVAMDYIHVDSVVDQFMVQLFRSHFGLNKNKHWRLETFL
jgi:hypothetical protein